MTEKNDSITERLENFIDWLEEMTDYGDWDFKVRMDVRQKLIETLTKAETSEKSKKEQKEDV
jgi:uncharacterized protein YjfI (DUF2170 family)